MCVFNISYLFIILGYNVVQGNQFFENGPDPGFKHPIFEGTYKDPSVGGDERCIYRFISQNTITFCKTSVEKNVYRSYKDYQKAKTGSVENSDDVSASLGTGGLWSFIMSFTATASTKLKSDSSFNTERKFFSESKGEIYMNRARCEVFEVDILKHLKPAFTSDFILALKELEHAAKHPSSSESQESMKDFFTEQYGTHYMSKVFMGASMTTENRYVGTETSLTLRQKRKNCSDNSYKMSVGGGVRGLDLSAEYENAAKKCKEGDANDKFFSENKFSEYTVVERGSTPTNDGREWRTNIARSPIPIRFWLRPISNLFLEEWLKEHDLDAALLREYFTNSTRNYCKVIILCNSSFI